MRYWIFNPGYEASVRIGAKSYTPPSSVQRFRADCAPLLLTLAAPGDRVLLMQPLPPSLSHPLFTTSLEGGALMPWGWAPELARYGELPYTLEEMRYLTSRERSVELWERVWRSGGTLFEPALQAPRLIGDEWAMPSPPFVLKELYSSSGRGVQIVSAPREVRPSVGAQRVLEPYLDIVEDVGVEFERAASGELRYLGLSRMINHSARYAGNHLHTVESPHPDMARYVAHLMEVLRGFDLGDYRGLLGIDTAIYRGSGGKHYIWPLLEINVRPTMGHVALALEQKYPMASRFEIRPFAHTGQLPELVSTTPLYLQEQTELAPGYHLLTPLLAETRFVALLRV